MMMMITVIIMMMMMRTADGMIVHKDVFTNVCHIIIVWRQLLRTRTIVKKIGITSVLELRPYGRDGRVNA